jgi:cytochrome oxidase Cu insertion factor (SCO1/SenC/PrrC family)
MLRWLATLAIAALLALAIFVPDTPLGRRGAEAMVRSDVEGAVGMAGERLPDLALESLEGEPIALADFRGHPLLLTFERSVDW